MDQEFPQLISPANNSPYMLVAFQKDILNSKLLTARCISAGAPEVTKNEKLVVIEDFLKELVQPSPLAYTPDQLSKQQLADFNHQKANFQKKVAAQQKSYTDIGQQLQQGYVKTCEQIVQKLTAQIQEETTNVDHANQGLKQTLNSDPETDASIPKPAEIRKRINELKGSAELPDYLFDLAKKLRAWQEAPQELTNWTKAKEHYYSNNLTALLQQEFSSSSKVAVKFWEQSIAKLGKQMLNIIQDDKSLKPATYVDLIINNAQSLQLVLSTMITDQTRLVLNLGHLTNEDSKSIAASLVRLQHQIFALQINWEVGQSKVSGLSNIAKAIGSISYLRVLQFRIHSTEVTSANAKDFFGEFKDTELTNLEEVSFDVLESSVVDAIPHIAKAIKEFGRTAIQRLFLHFRNPAAKAQLDDKSAALIGDALGAYKALKLLSINFGGYSLGHNNIKDKGFEGLVQHISQLADTLIQLEINVGRNGLTDNSIVSLKRAFKSARWQSLKKVTLALHYNKIGEVGASKLGKLLSGLPILIEADLNLTSTNVDAVGLKYLLNVIDSSVAVKINARQTNVTREEYKELNDNEHANLLA